jgi:hypothetical protein
MATTPIHAHGFNEDLSPSNLENNKRLEANTLRNYLGRYKECLKEQFPQHNDFHNLADDNDPKWWSEMLMRRD